MRQYARRTEPLFDVFTSIEALRWKLFSRNIDERGWELHLRYPFSSGKQTKYLSHGDSFLRACKAGELDIMKAMVERTQVDLEETDQLRRTPLHYAIQGSPPCGAVPA